MHWKRYNINFNSNSSELNKRLKQPFPLCFTSCHTDVPLKYAKEPTKTRLNEMGALKMLGSYGSWPKLICAALSKAGVECLMIPTSSSSLLRSCYYVLVRFGKQVIYLQTKPQKKTPWIFTQIYIIPYGGFGGLTLNTDYLLPDSLMPMPHSSSYYPSGGYNPYMKRLRVKFGPAGECQVLLMSCQVSLKLSSDWSTWPKAIQNQVVGEILWTDGNINYPVSKYYESHVQCQ